jgi:hypothetical protein
MSHSIQLAERLNADCQCVSLDSARLEAELERVSPGFHAEVMEGRPHLFSSSVAFVGAEHVARMARLVAAVERVVALPAYREHVLGWAAELGAPCHACARRVPWLRLPPGCSRATTHRDQHQCRRRPAQRGAGACPEGLLRRRRDPAAGRPRRDTPEHLFLDMFRAEWRAFADAAGNCAPLRSVAIVDEAPRTQYLYPEFVLFQRLFEQAGIRAVICDPGELAFRDGALWHGGLRIDLVYNRLTDFSLDAPANAVLRAAWLADAALLTPHPQAHALYADKRNLVALCDESLLETWGVDAETRAILAAKIPHTELVRPDMADDLWARRKQPYSSSRPPATARRRPIAATRSPSACSMRSWPATTSPRPWCRRPRAPCGWARRRWNSSSTCATMCMPGTCS